MSVIPVYTKQHKGFMFLVASKYVLVKTVHYNQIKYVQHFMFTCSSGNIELPSYVNILYFEALKLMQAQRNSGHNFKNNRYIVYRLYILSTGKLS